MNRPEAAYAEHTVQGHAEHAQQADADELSRADFYTLIARLLLRAPDAALLAALAGADSLAAEHAGNPLELAWEKLILACGVIDADAVREEFDALFISIGTPQVNPYASLYLAGFMMEKPLAALRSDLARLGLARAAGSGELEDHLGALCETMRILIAGAPGMAPQPLAVQKNFFEKHIATWYMPCLEHIRAAPEANFYQRVADVIQAYFEIEAEAFTMDEVL